MPADVIIRPDGRPYRPGKIRAVLLEDDWPGEVACLVLGTRDEGVARELAAREIQAYDASMRPGDCTPGWWRLAIRRGESFYEWDEVRGAAGFRFEITEEGHVP